MRMRAITGSFYHRGVSSSRRVYSTEDGDLRGREDAAPAPTATSDGIVRVSRETSGRRGKGVTVVRGLPRADVASMATELKKLCGSGGTAKDGVVEIQGDHREKLVARLRERGYTVRG
jgi:translation initiation factor 1